VTTAAARRLRDEEAYLPWPPEVPATDADPMGDGVADLRRAYAADDWFPELAEL
jgi:hypothetical protein